MQASVSLYTAGKWEQHSVKQSFINEKAQLALCFGSKEFLERENVFEKISARYPAAEIVISSTAGEIYQAEVHDNSLVVAALYFDKTTIKTAAVNIKNFNNSYDAATELASKLPKEKLVHLLVFSDGNLVNGSELVKGLATRAAEKVMATGGLAGDGPNFTSTLVGLNEKPTEGNIVAVGFYGDSITITHGSQGGWDVFGMEKRITKSKSNVLFELENQNALDLYKKYLGAEAEKLPGSALLFPLSVIIPGATKPVVRTILSINETEKSMTFAGDVPEGSKVRFMKADFNKLTQAASSAANNTLQNAAAKPVFSLLISCVGRKLILGDKTVEEVKAVNNSYNGDTVMAGFYSYGEISPFNESNDCQLHNQTMTITSFYEQ
jgi:hypothetical protein